MINIENKEQCSGCRACSEICPKGCISMQADAEGFDYPVIDNDKCINCGLCERTCPQLIVKEPSSNSISYAAKSVEVEDVRTSSSGGIFTQLAKWTIARNGIVYGTKFDDSWNVVFDKAELVEQIEPLKTSKYVQANTNGVFSKIKKNLQDNKWVTFVGTPCQVKALHLYLKKDYPTLLTADIICHGVPSPLVWNRYLSYRKQVDLADPEKYTITKINFRDKRIGWEKHCLSIKYSSVKSNKEQIYSECLSDDLYIRLFESDAMLRLSCYDCKSKGGCSGSDITIGDFWGIDKVVPEFNDHEGCSIVIVHTALGGKVLSGLKLQIREADIQLSLKENPSYFKSTAMPPQRALFFKLIKKNADFDYIKQTIFPSLSFTQRIVKSLSIRIKRFLTK